MRQTIFLLTLALSNAIAFAQSSHEALLKNLKFRNIGPAIMGGRVDDFAVVESDPRIVYVGSAAGGIERLRVPTSEPFVCRTA